MEQGQKITKDIIFNSLYIFIKLSIGLIFSIIITRFLSPKDFGSYILLMSIMSITALVTNLGFPNSIIKYISEYKGRNDNQSINNIVGYCLSFELKFGLLVGLLLLLLTPLWKMLFSVNVDDIMVCAAGVLPLAFITIMSSIARGLRKFDLLVSATFIILICLLSFSFLALLSGLRVKALLACVIFSNLIGLFSFYLFLRKDVSFSLKARIDDELRKRVVGYSKYLTGIILLDLIVWQQSEVFFLGALRTPQEVAYYSLAFTLSVGMMTIPQAFTTVLFPVFSEVSGAGQKDKLNSLYISAIKWVTIIVLPIFLGGIFFAKPIFSIIYPASYAQSASLFQILIISSSIVSVCGVASSALYAAEKQVTILKIAIIVAIENIILDLIFIPNLGAKGATIAKSLSQVSSAIIIMIIFCHFSKISLPVKFLIGTSVAALPMSLLFLLFNKLYHSLYSSSLFILIIPLFAGLLLYLAGLLFLKIIHVGTIISFLKSFATICSLKD